MKKNYKQPKSRSVAFRVRTTLLAESLTGNDEKIEFGGEGENLDAGSKKGGIWDSMDED